MTEWQYRFAGDCVQINIDQCRGKKGPMIGRVTYSTGSTKSGARFQLTNRRQFRKHARPLITVDALKEALILGRRNVTDSPGIQKFDRMIKLAAREMDKQRTLRSARRAINSALNILGIG